MSNKKNKKNPKENLVCLKIRKSVMEESLDFIKKLRIDLEQNQQTANL